MVHIDLFYSSDNRVFARRRGQRLLNEIPKSDELTEPECIAARKGFVMSESREERTSFDREDRRGLSNGR